MALTSGRVPPVIVNHVSQGFGSVPRSKTVWIPARPGAEKLTKEWGMQRLMKVCRCDQGATAIEYALVASLISIAAIVGMNNLGNKIDVMFNNVSNHL